MSPTSTLITIRERSFSDSVFTTTISFNTASEFEIAIKNPSGPDTDDLLEWYFEQYINQPFDDVKVHAAVQAIYDYGTNLFKELFIQDPDLNYQYRTALQHGPDNFTIEVVGDSSAFQAIYWESLHDPNAQHPFTALGTTFVRKNVRPLQVHATAKASPTINLLIVTARPREESDVSYRTIQRPLIDLIQNSAIPIRPHILRPGTYEALVRHLDDKTGYYHLIHFDVHGSLMDYASYKQYQYSMQNLSFLQHSLFKGQFALQELEEKDFKWRQKSLSVL